VRESAGPVARVPSGRRERRYRRSRRTSASGADESVRRAAEWTRENLSDLPVQPPQVSSGEVAIQF